MPKLTIEEAAMTGFTHKYKLDATAITALGSGNQVTIATVPAGGIVTAAAVYEISNFAGTSSNLTLDVGITAGDPDEYIDAADLDALTKTIFCTGDGFTVGTDVATGNGVVNNTASDVAVLAEVNFTGTVTAGEWMIALNILDPKALAI